MFSMGYARMEEEYNTRVSALPQTFETIAKTSVGQVKTHIGLLLDNLHAVSGKDRAALDKKKTLQTGVKSLVLAWAEQWRSPQQEEVKTAAQGQVETTLAIPAEFIEDLDEADGRDETSLESEGNDDSDMDSNSDSDGDSGSGSGSESPDDDDDDIKMEEDD
ncbi:hypothetical protein VTK26DRAFT_2515 [Humicola hyalothermophila]